MNNLLSGFQAGQGIGQGLRGAFVERPRIKEAMSQVQQGQDPMQVYQSLAATDPQTANQFLQMMNNQQSVQGNQQVMQQRQQQIDDRARYDEVAQQGNDPKTLKMLTMIDPERTNQTLAALNQIDDNSLRYFNTSLLGASGMTNEKAQRKVLSDLATDMEEINPALSGQVREIANAENPQERSVMLQGALRMIAEGGFSGKGRRVQSTQAEDAGTRLVYSDGSVEFIPASEEEQRVISQHREGQIPKLSAALEKKQIESVDNARKSREQVSKVQDLRAGFGEIQSQGGAVTSLGEYTKQFFGDEDAETMLRTQYRAIRNSQAVNNLPPGVASDKDIELALSGFPKDNASPEFISQWLEGVEKLERYNAKYNDFMAEWISNAGNIFTTRRPFTIGGIQVEPGDTKNDVFEQYLEQTGGVGNGQRNFEDEYGVN